MAGRLSWASLVFRLRDPGAATGESSEAAAAAAGASWALTPPTPCSAVSFLLLLALGVVLPLLLLLLISLLCAHLEGGSFAGVTPAALAAALAPEPPTLLRPLGWGTDSIFTGRGASASSRFLGLRARASRGGLGPGIAS